MRAPFGARMRAPALSPTYVMRSRTARTASTFGWSGLPV